MNKILLIVFASVIFLFLSSGIAQAAGLCQYVNSNGAVTGPNLDIDPAVAADITTFVTNGPGLVPCGVSVEKVGDSIRVICPCQLQHFFIMLLRIFRFLLWNLAAPIVGLMITIGGVLILLSGVNPNWVSTGKTIIWWSVIGIGTMLCAWLIISILMTRVLGIQFDWTIFLF